MNLVLADKDDIEIIIELIEKFYDNSPYYSFPFCSPKIRNYLKEKIGKEDFLAILLKDEDKVVGMLLALKTELSFSLSTITAELAWWVDPEYRGKAPLELLNAYEYWSKNVAKADACQMVCLQDMSALALDRVYKRRGYEHVEAAYIKRWN